MTSPAANSSDLDAIVSATRHLLLDFDGPICSVFAGLPAHIIADSRSRLGRSWSLCHAGRIWPQNDA